MAGDMPMTPIYISDRVMPSLSPRHEEEFDIDRSRRSCGERLTAREYYELLAMPALATHVTNAYVTTRSLPRRAIYIAPKFEQRRALSSSEVRKLSPYR